MREVEFLGSVLAAGDNRRRKIDRWNILVVGGT